MRQLKPGNEIGNNVYKKQSWLPSTQFMKWGRSGAWHEILTSNVKTFQPWVDEGAALGAWMLLEAGQQEGVRRSERALIPNVCNAELSA